MLVVRSLSDLSRKQVTSRCHWLSRVHQWPVWPTELSCTQHWCHYDSITITVNVLKIYVYRIFGDRPDNRQPIQEKCCTHHLILASNSSTNSFVIHIFSHNALYACCVCMERAMCVSSDIWDIRINVIEHSRYQKQSATKSWWTIEYT